MDDNRRVALYARVSSQRQADEATIHSQVAALEQRLQADGCRLEPDSASSMRATAGPACAAPAWSGCVT